MRRVDLDFDYETLHGDLIPVQATVEINGATATIMDLHAFNRDGGELPHKTIMAIEEKAIERAFEEKPETLGQILSVLSQADDALIELTPEQMTQLGEQLAGKIDSYKYVDEKLEAEEERLSKRLAEFAAAKKSITNGRARLKEILAYHMKSKGFSTIPGIDYVASLRSSKALKLKVDEPTSLNIMQYPDWVRVAYSWDKKAITDALKSGDLKAAELAEFQENYHARIDVRKGRITDGK